VDLDDGLAPVLGLGGSLLGPGSRRGAQQLGTVASDAGGGVRRIVAQVNGEPLDAATAGCALANGVGLLLRPCPAQGSLAIPAATGSEPFRQGPNEVRVCALDLARVDPNRTCRSERVRVDNLCPLSSVAGSRLRAHISGPAKLESNERAAVVGRLADADGTDVAGARVCVAARTRLRATTERVVRTPLTDERGRFRVRLPAGPSREVRVAHWATSESALERYLHLRVRARPLLRIRPGRPLHNGESARFRVRLPGPSAGHRRVVLQANAGGRWIPVRNGHTDGGGRWRTSHRFRSTTGTRTYRFRALVPRQRGYPYLAGRSDVRRKVVSG
jgi:hypothetical protein